jgi:hypothetical protein
MKEFFTRLAYKTTGFKSLFVVAVLASLWLHDFTDNNADVLMMLIGTVLGAKAVQYAADAMKGKRDG